LTTFEDYFGGHNLSEVSVALNGIRASKIHLDRFVALLAVLERFTNLEQACVETANRLDRLRAQEDPLKAIVAEAEAAQARLAGMQTEIARHKADAEATAKATVDAAHGTARDIVRGAHQDAEKIRNDALTYQADVHREKQEELGRLDAPITARREEHDGIVAAIGELRARLGG
jgi:vacuolar-type H+-ATPase subunit H